METLDKYIAPYIITNVFFILCIAAAIWKPIYCRVFLVLVFLSASVINTINAFTHPESYLIFGELSFHNFYSDFIYGSFAEHIKLYILIISAGQMLIAAGLVLKRHYTGIACLGGIIFGFAIAPLGIGSAFPSTVFMAIAFLILLRNYRHDYIWKWEQYKSNGEEISQASIIRT
jgi:hypothetical protein